MNENVTTNRVVGVTAGAVIFLVIALAVLTGLMSSRRSEIESGKVYKIGYTYLTELEGVKDDEGLIQTIKA